jgi:hypothetical protein
LQFCDNNFGYNDSQDRLYQSYKYYVFFDSLRNVEFCDSFQ